MRKRSAVSHSSPSVSLTSTSMCIACLVVLTPPAALTPMICPVRQAWSRTVSSITSTTPGVAPVLALPVDVLMKSAPASIASCDAWRTCA